MNIMLEDTFSWTMLVFDTTTAVIEIRQPSHTPLAESKRASLPADINLVKGRFCVAQVTSFDPLKAGIPCVGYLGTLGNGS